jgi:hypothetical protein
MFEGFLFDRRVFCLFFMFIAFVGVFVDSVGGE